MEGCQYVSGAIVDYFFLGDTCLLFQLYIKVITAKNFKKKNMERVCL